MADKNMHCIWSGVYTEQDKIVLEDGITITGLLSTVFAMWLSCSIIISNLYDDPSYKNLNKFISASWFSRLVCTAARYIYINYFNSPEWHGTTCNLIGFLDTFLIVYEVEWLTHLAIERFVVAKYRTHGWPLNMKHYKLYQMICIFFATLYSTMPFLGIGQYSYDLACTTCTYDLIIPDNWKQYMILAQFSYRSFKSVGLIVLMFFWTSGYEDRFSKTEENIRQLQFTKNMKIVCLVNIICWSPITIIKGIILVDPRLAAFINGVLVNWAVWIHWLSPVATAGSLFLTDKQIRFNMLNIHLIRQDHRKEN